MPIQESTPTSMTVEFEASLEDFVGVHMHVLNRTGRAKRWKWLNAIGIAIGMMFCFALLFQGRGTNLLIPISVSIVAGSSVLAFGNSYLRLQIRKQLEKLIDSDPTVVIIGIQTSGLFYNQLGTSVEVEWHKVESLEETDEEIFFELVGGSSVSVPKRAFDSETECEQFIVLGANYINSIEELSLNAQSQ